jgi:hypothetical protein
MFLKKRPGSHHNQGNTNTSALIHHLVGQSTLNKCASRKTIQIAFPEMDL